MPTGNLSDSDEQKRINTNESDDLFKKTYGSGVTRDLKEREDHPNNTDSSDDNKGISDKEISSGGWRSSYAGLKTPTGKVLSGANVRAILKKRGILGLIGVIGVGGGLVATFLFSPGILLVQMKEALFNRFDYQLTSMDTRSNILLDKKIKSQFTGGVCTNVLSIKCRFSTISDPQAKLLAAAGIEIEDGAQKFGNRIKPTTLLYKGEKIAAADFSTRYASDVEFRNAMRKAYNPRFAGFADKVWAKVAGKIGLTKQRALPDGDPTKKAQVVENQVENGKKLSLPDDGIDCPADGSQCKRKSDGSDLTDDESKAARATKAAAIQGVEDATHAAERSAEKAIVDAAVKGGKASLGTVANFVKVTGFADAGCSAYTAVRGIGFAAKTVRALQLARYAMVFMNTADQIKAGTATPEDVSYLGGILTSVAIDAASGAKRKAAMDSFGMQYAMYGTVGKSNSYVSQFMAGGGLSGDLISITDFINKSTGGAPRTTCATLANGWVQLGSIAFGIVLLAVPGVDVPIAAADVAKMGAGVVAQAGLSVLPELLKDIVAGDVTKGIVGEDAGNAIASGAGSMMSNLAQAGGNAPLSVDDAVAYTNAQNQTIAQYSKDDQATLSPLDPSSPYTFIGSLTSTLLPYISNVQAGSLTGSLSSLSSVVSHSVGSLLPITSAVSNQDLRDAYTSCTDPDYKDYLKIATDPFCNPVYGIPAQYLNKDPNTIIDELSAGGYITEEGVPQGDYKDFISNCIERDRPLGDTGDAPDGNDGTQCLIQGDTIPANIKADFYVFYIDNRVNEGMDGYAEASSDVSSKQDIAKKIVAKGKVTYLGDVRPTLEEIANGTTDPNAEPCGINIDILKIIDAITDVHSIKISDINRHCTDTSLGAGTASRHYAGNGSAIDIAAIDGVATNGRDSGAQEVIKIAMPILSKSASVGNSFSQIGQAYCAGGSITTDPGVNQIDDFCTHVHLDVPPWSDPDLKQSAVY